jgi:hypothetical protein
MLKFRNLFYSKSLVLSGVFTSLMVAAPAYSRTDVLIEESGYELRFDVDKNRAIEISGLPFAGEYMYSAQQGILYIRHPKEKETYFLSLANLYKEIPQAKVAKIGPAVKQFGVETTEWRIKFPLRTCATVHASRPAGEDTNLNVADLVNINALLSYLHIVNSETCTFYRLSSATGRVLGLPLWSLVNGTESKVVGIIHNELDSHILPKDAKPLTEEMRIHFLSDSLDERRRAIFEQTATHLPVKAQYKVVKRLLIEQLDPPNMGKSKHWTPPAFPNHQ